MATEHSHHPWTTLVILVLVGTSACGATETGEACGDAGTFSSLAADGVCVCDDGYTWADAESSSDFSCVLDSGDEPCRPDCAERLCGDDGCDGSCGECVAGMVCTPSGWCAIACVPDCSGRVCGDNGCGGSCGECGTGESCAPVGQCFPDCVPSCLDRECGDDGCGGSCGPCPTGTCVDGACLPVSQPIGGPCSDAADCDGAAADCLPEAEGLPGGYCVTRGCALAGCDGDAVCLWTDLARSESACFAACDTAEDCRTDYACDGHGSCWPADLCRLGDRRCVGAQVERCLDGAWQPEADCAAEGDICLSAASGEAACVCVPNCGAAICGGDGCGGTCGLCAADEICTYAGTCLAAGAALDCRALSHCISACLTGDPAALESCFDACSAQATTTTLGEWAAWSDCGDELTGVTSSYIIEYVTEMSRQCAQPLATCFPTDAAESCVDTLTCVNGCGLGDDPLETCAMECMVAAGDTAALTFIAACDCWVETDFCDGVPPAELPACEQICAPHEAACFGTDCDPACGAGEICTYAGSCLVEEQTLDCPAVFTCIEDCWNAPYTGCQDDCYAQASYGTLVAFETAYFCIDDAGGYAGDTWEMTSTAVKSCWPEVSYCLGRDRGKTGCGRFFTCVETCDADYVTSCTLGCAAAITDSAVVNLPPYLDCQSAINYCEGASDYEACQAQCQPQHAACVGATTPEDNPYSCANNCGQRAPGGCDCSGGCVSAGDCCLDYVEVCLQQPVDLYSCVNNCDGVAAGGCRCDNGCTADASCCFDFLSECVGGADNLFSCAGNCGDQAAGGCYCDSGCISEGDCCLDYLDQCFQDLADAFSCENNCGGLAPGGCACDAQCLTSGDCCFDYLDFCVGADRDCRGEWDDCIDDCTIWALFGGYGICVDDCNQEFVWCEALN